ncbi:MAG: DNA-3-methyladenine glycosylase [Candidatus Firestonebacteria bacterium]
MVILKRDFYSRKTIKVAKELLGKILIRKVKNKILSGRIVEVEAYLGKDDPASHASHGKLPRNSVMFGEPGLAYVYFCYGNHFLMNVVTEKEGTPGAVLIRALEPLKGIAKNLTNGPGKLTKALSISKKFNSYDLTKGKELYIVDDGFSNFKIVKTERVGIKKGKERLLRFYINGNRHISKK